MVSDLKAAMMITVFPKELSEMMNNCTYIANFVKAKAFNSRYFFIVMRRNGIWTSITSILYACALGFTEQSYRESLRASAWNKSVRIKSEQTSSVYTSGSQSMSRDPNKGREGSKNGSRQGDPKLNCVFSTSPACLCPSVAHRYLRKV